MIASVVEFFRSWCPRNHEREAPEARQRADGNPKIWKIFAFVILAGVVGQKYMNRSVNCAEIQLKAREYSSLAQNADISEDHAMIQGQAYILAQKFDFERCLVQHHGSKKQWLEEEEVDGTDRWWSRNQDCTLTASELSAYKEHLTSLSATIDRHEQISWNHRQEENALREANPHCFKDE